MNIIAKKQKEFYGTKNGLIKPIFERNDKEFKQVNPENYPNSGNIFITAGFDKFEDDYFYEFAYDLGKIHITRMATNQNPFKRISIIWI